MLDSLVGKVASVSSISWLRLLPWAMLAFGAGVGGAGAWGWHEGAKVTAAGYEAEKEQAAEEAAQASIAAIKKVAAITLDIVSTSTDFVSEINLTRARRVEIVRKVTADAKANIAASCVVPPTTAGLRQQQVEESAAAYAADRPM